MWLPAVLGEIKSRFAISMLDSPRATSVSTSTSRAVSPDGPERRRGTRWPAAPRTASAASPSSRPAVTSARSSRFARDGVAPAEGAETAHGGCVRERGPLAALHPDALPSPRGALRQGAGGAEGVRRFDADELAPRGECLVDLGAGQYNRQR